MSGAMTDINGVGESRVTPRLWVCTKSILGGGIQMGLKNGGRWWWKMVGGRRGTVDQETGWGLEDGGWYMMGGEG